MSNSLNASTGMD